MVISFSVKEARNQLLNKGVVYTFRWRRRAFFTKGKGDVEHTWANEGRTKPKLCYVDIHEIGEFDPDEVDKKTRIPNHPLWKYVEFSGFESLLDWESAISDKAPPFGVTEGWLYKVTLQNLGDSAEVEA